MNMIKNSTIGTISGLLIVFGLNGSIITSIIYYNFFAIFNFSKNLNTSSTTDITSMIFGGFAPIYSQIFLTILILCVGELIIGIVLYFLPDRHCKKEGRMEIQNPKFGF
ncbi:MAG: hypothetical protein LBT66_04315 [Methanobrevibacter sp.]|nr:hypothetical protein [Candidatus Methanovirga meridionalis]